jgi:hypothetical protein
MKISVRRKVANGLVIFLQTSALAPRIAETATTAWDAAGLDSFSADDSQELRSNPSHEAELLLNQETKFQGRPPGGGRPGEDPPGGGPPPWVDPPGNPPPGGDPTGGDPTGGDPSGGGPPPWVDPPGNPPPGGDPTGGDPTGGDPSGGGPPPWVDPPGNPPPGGDPTGGDPTGGDPTGGDPTGGDPTGGDPSGGGNGAVGLQDPQACAPALGAATVALDAPARLITAEDGSSDRFTLSLSARPEERQFYHFVSSHPNEVQAVPKSLTLFENACRDHTVVLVGQNDSESDGDVAYTVEVRDQNDTLLDTLSGVNLDNDNFSEVAVDILGPPNLRPDKVGAFTIRVANLGQSDLDGNSLNVDLTTGLTAKGHVCSLLSGKACQTSAVTTDAGLRFNGIDLQRGDTLLISVDVLMDGIEAGPQKLSARFLQADSGRESDQDVRSD